MSDPHAPIEFEESSGNVFEDIGFDKAAAARLAHKAELVGVLHRFQEEQGLGQAAFGRLVGIPQPRLSRLYNGKIAGMSTDKLLDAIARLGGHVTIRVEPHPAPRDAGRVELELA
jgi:predicted XRE-type DNA-binding protein